MLCGAVAHANPPRSTSATAGGVRLVGVARSSSVDVPRNPEYVLTNLTNDPRVVELVTLAALDQEGSPRALAIRSPRRIVLAPRARRSVEVEFTGQTINLGGGLSHRHFALTVTTGGHRLTAIASNAYICRIPLRHPTP